MSSHTTKKYKSEMDIYEPEELFLMKKAKERVKKIYGRNICGLAVTHEKDDTILWFTYDNPEISRTSGCISLKMFETEYGEWLEKCLKNTES